MRVTKLGYFSVALLFSISFQNGEATLMLGSMMMAAKAGLMLGKIGVGGMMMMLLAASQQDGKSLGGTGAYGKKRSVRSTQKENSKVNGADETLLTERMIRQIDSTFDSLTCIPKFVCSISAEPPSKKTGFLNDYTHLLQLLVSPDDEDSEEDTGKPSKKKNKKTKPKLETKINDQINDELLDEDPSLLPFILKDVVKQSETSDEDYDDDDDEVIDDDVMDDEDPEEDYEDDDDVLDIDDEEIFPQLFHYSPPATPPPKTSYFSSFFPKIEAGLGTKIKDPDFDSDPFFKEFRALKSLFENAKQGDHNPLRILDINDSLKGKPMTRKERKLFIRRKAKELKENNDPVRKYKIAAEVGRQLKNKTECSKVFKKCPYKWEEVTGVVSNIRNAIANHPLISGNKEKVVYLDTKSGSEGNQTSVSIAAPAQGDTGPTTVIHDLGNGNLMEISMKLMPMVKVPKVPSVETLKFESSNREIHKRPSSPSSSFATANIPKLTEAEIDAAALIYQNKNKDVSQVPTKKETKRKPGRYPVLLDGIAELPKEFQDDDEMEDAYPVLVPKIPYKFKKNSNKLKGKPRPSLKDENDDEAELDDPDTEEYDDEDEDEDAYGDERKLIPSSSVLRRRESPAFLGVVPPIPIRFGGGKYSIISQGAIVF